DSVEHERGGVEGMDVPAPEEIRPPDDTALRPLGLERAVKEPDSREDAQHQESHGCSWGTNVLPGRAGASASSSSGELFLRSSQNLAVTHRFSRCSSRSDASAAWRCADSAFPFPAASSASA